ncbi:MAG: pilus assembly protein PilP [Thermodesulfobacteriota bacterium]
MTRPRRKRRSSAGRAALLWLLPAVFLVLAACGEEPPPPPPAKAKAKATKAAPAAPAEPVVALPELPPQPASDFVYVREGRPDPFRPFVSEKRIQQEAEAEAEVLTGMQIFEPGQLTLVAILFANNEPMAMVQDSVGKGYVIRPGTPIGRSGVVAEIVPNQVVVKERYTTPVGEERERMVEMVLRKEGEQP